MPLRAHCQVSKSSPLGGGANPVILSLIPCAAIFGVPLTVNSKSLHLFAIPWSLFPHSEARGRTSDLRGMWLVADGTSKVMGIGFLSGGSR